jgi:hypothetical protein
MRSEAYHKKHTLAAKKLLEFIREHPEGVTRKDIDNAGLSIWGIDKIIKLKLVRCSQVKEPERGPRCYHWVWTAQGDAK